MAYFVVVFIASFHSIFGQIEPSDNHILDFVTDNICTEIEGFSQYFDSLFLTCRKCSQNLTLQTASSNGLSCICRSTAKYVKNFGGDQVTCQKCNDNEVASTDGWECKSCADTDDPLTCKCSDNMKITVERALNGSWISVNQSSGGNKDQCIHCDGKTIPSRDKRRCIRCTDDLKVGNYGCVSDCPTNLKAGEYCFIFDVEELITNSADMTEIPRIDGTDSIQSSYFQTNLRAAFVMCTQFENSTACQLVANLCSLILYNERSGRICSLIQQYEQYITKQSSLYSLLYFSKDADKLIDTDVLQEAFTLSPPTTLPFKAVVHSLDGQYLRTVPLTGRLLQLCLTSEPFADAAYTFGTYYEHKCKIKAYQLWNKAQHPMEFFDIYFQYTVSGEDLLYKIPLHFLQLRDNSGRTVNDGKMSDWKVTRRMFLVDNRMNIPATSDEKGDSETHAHYVRYLKSVKIHFELQSVDSSLGRINVPYFTLLYDDVSLVDAEAGKEVEISFITTYTMVWLDTEINFQIAVGTLSSLATVYAGYRAWVWSKRAGRIAIDFPTLVNFLLFASSSLSNAFFLAVFGIAFYWFIFFKRQDVMYLVHPEGLVVVEWTGLLVAAFVLRCLSLLQTVVMQCSADVFFIDWERSRGVSRAQDGKKISDVPVSIWRTYLVANEWNEIQTTQKINIFFQVFTSLIFLEYIGFVDTTTMDADGSVGKSGDMYMSKQSFIYRVVLATILWIIIALVQLSFRTFLYDRFVEDVRQQFVDLCSMANISVFIMTNSQFGYYIHGRSVHGKADTDMGDMAEMMKKEEDDLCGKRGLVADTEEQTFMMSLPRRLRVKYEQVYLPAALEAAGAQSRMEQGKAGVGRLAGTGKEKSVQAYQILNRFLCGFLEHSLRDVDYVVKDKTLMESVMDNEFLDATDKGIFYTDNGHSFDQALFYGNEISLTLFDILLFCVSDLIWGHYFLDGVVVIIVHQLVVMIRDAAGRKNLARKTLVDERFLI